MSQKPELLVVSWGGGVNSTAMVVGLLAREIRPDLILFADTGGERARTYQFLARFTKWLNARGLGIVTVRHPGRTLEEDCLDAERLPSIACGFAACSDKWKRRPIDKYLSTWPPAIEAWERGEKVTKAIGYDAGPRDVARAGKVADRQSPRWTLWYPLIEWGWDRAACEAAIVAAGLPNPGKSSCFFCPAMKRREVLELQQQEPELLARALAIEDNANLTTIKGLGRSWRWSSLLAEDRQQGRLHFSDDDEQRLPCLCDDGGET